MVPESNSINWLILTTGVIGTIEGVAWSLLSLIALLIYYGAVITDSSNIETKDIGDCIKILYLKNDLAIDVVVPGVIVNRDVFSYFMYIYLFISVCLLVVSSVFIWIYATNKGKDFHDKAIKTWIVLTGSSSVLDFILLCLIINDYSKYQSSVSNNEDLYPVTYLILAAVGIVMTLAARGFVLWIINVVFVVIWINYIYKKHDMKKPSDTVPVIDAYSTPRTPWTSSSFSDPIRSDYDNKAFENDNDNSRYQFIDDRSNRNNVHDRDLRNYKGFPQSNNARKNNDEHQWNNDRYYKEGNAQFAHNYIDQQNRAGPYGPPSGNRTAKIGRQGGQRSPPLNVAPPFIPDPDYSPPGSPKIRGVLRPRSNYM